MRTEQEIRDRIKKYKKEIAEGYGFMNNPILSGLIRELEWTLEGVDEVEERRHNKRMQRIKDGKWMKKFLGKEFMEGKEVHHAGEVTQESEAGKFRLTDIGKSYTYVLEEEVHKKIHGKK